MGYSYIKNEEHSIIETAMSAARRIDGEVGRDIESLKSVAITLSGSQALVANDLETFEIKLRDREGGWVRDGDGGWIVLIDRNGQQRVNSLVPHGQPLPNVSYQNDKLGLDQVFAHRETRVSDLILGSISKKYMVAVTAPVVINGEVKYAISVAVPATYFKSLANTPNGWVTALADSKGMIISRSIDNNKWVGQQVSHSSWEQMRASNNTEEVWGDNIRTLDGNPVVGSFRRFSSGWHVLVSAYPEVYIEPAQRFGRFLLWMLLLSVILPITFATILGRRISGALHALVKKAQSVAHGIETYPIETDLIEVNTAGRSMDTALTNLHSEISQKDNLVQVLNTELDTVEKKLK
jgi:hypothetical protein